MKKNLILFFIILVFFGCKGNGQGIIFTKKKSDTPAITPCDVADQTAPVLIHSLFKEYEGTPNSSPKFSWPEATDNCKLGHYEVAIGTNPSEQNVLEFTNIGLAQSFVQSGLKLFYDENYYFFVRAVDTSGNLSSLLISKAWKIFSPQTINNLVLWLDVNQKTSVLDKNNLTPTDDLFDGGVKTWLDVSGTSTDHNFKSKNHSPTWNQLEKGIEFNGTKQFLTVADNTDLNLGVINARSINIAFKTANDIHSRQVIYEEGGTVRGINLYIDQGKLYCGFWNKNEDGDGIQDYVGLEQNLSLNEKYVATIIFDYTHYESPSGVDGSFKCFLNSQDLGEVSITSRLFPHPGDIGIGAVVDGSYFHDGKASSSNNTYFNGYIFELMVHNYVLNEEERTQLMDSLIAKWND